MTIPEHTRAGLVALSPTRAEGGLRCLRKHAIEDMLSQQPDGASGPGAPEFGKRLHAAASIYWNTDESAAGTEYLRGQSWPLDAKHHLGLALQCWAGYVQGAQLHPLMKNGDELEWEAIAIEERVVMDVSPSLKFSFQMDRLVQNVRTKALCLVDIKTASRCDARWRQQWARSLQMKLYAEAVSRKYNQSLESIVIEGIDKSNGSLNLHVLPEFSRDMLDEAWRSLLWVARHDADLLDASKMDGVVDAEVLTRNALVRSPFSPAECFVYGAPCAYLPLCDAEPSERVALLRDGYVYHEPDYV